MREAKERGLTRPPPAGKVLLITANSFGRGSEDLGRVLLLSLLSTLAENETLPEKIILSNSGVRIACEDPDTITALRKLEERGVDILSCGTCLKYFQMEDKLKVGRVSNIIEILNALLSGESLTLA